jgi:methionyl-tRNA formyltransferase
MTNIQPAEDAMTKLEFSVLFLGKDGDAYCRRALEFLQERASHLTACLGAWGDPLPAAAQAWEGDYVISYLSRWVVPEDLLRRAKRAAINFHPASPEYPGIGCNNFALYENATEYGVTCHHMAAKVDSGAIIAVRRFPIYPEDNVATLLERTYQHQVALFFDIVGLITEGKELPVSLETWTRPAFTRKQFNELFKITPDMSQEEIARRIRAVSYGPWQPFVELRGYRFHFKPED